MQRGVEPTTDLTLEGLVHDLNNVFETVAEAAELLAGDPRWTELAATIRRSVERGRGIAFGFRDTGAASVDLDLVLESAIQFAGDFLTAVHRPAVRFVRSCDPGLRLGGTSSDWERVFVNLFLNAAQAMTRGGQVEISTPREPGHVLIIVADNGPGFPERILPEVFKPYVSTGSGRSGLGLHIVDSIVRKNGGAVSASNRAQSAGAAVSIRLPIPALAPEKFSSAS